MAALIPYIIALSAVVFYAGLSPMAKKIGYNLPPFSFIAASSFMLFCIAGSIAFVKEKDMALSSMDQIEWRGLLLFSLINLAAYALSRCPLQNACCAIPDHWPHNPYCKWIDCRFFTYRAFPCTISYSLAFRRSWNFHCSRPKPKRKIKWFTHWPLSAAI